MAEGTIDLARCRILISNDDGISSPGIAALEAIARDLSGDVWVVAPEQEQSGASHSLTTRHPLRIREIAPRRYAVDGTPTDCVLIAVKRLLRDRPPDLVLSGINAGSNVGEDLTYSGTVAAAMEATLLGIPAMALSQEYRDRNDVPWQTGDAFAPEIIRRLLRLLLARQHPLQHQLSRRPAGRGRRVRGHQPGPAGDRRQPDRARRSARPAVLLDRPGSRLWRRRRARHRCRRARRQQDLDHSDPPRPDQRAGAGRVAAAFRIGPIRPRPVGFGIPASGGNQG